MTAPQNPFDPAEILRRKLQEQAWYKRYANTVTTGIGTLTGLAWLLLQTGLDVPPTVTNGVLGVIAFGTLIGVWQTPNGVTERQIKEIEEYAGRHRA